jgi:DNA (cytosine-5)-methyltransferase 3A
MNVLSLFDGMSCGRIALERAGIEVNKYYASEIDKHAIKVSEANYPDIIRLGDVNNWKSWDLEKIDLIIAGSPCQGFSKIGKELAFDDPRSALFFTFLEILNTIKCYNPDIKFLLENVRMKKDHLDIISDKLNVEPVMINSKLVSAQNRVRFYWCNWDIEQPLDKGVSFQDIKDTDPVRLAESKVNHTPSRVKMWADGKGTGGKVGGCYNITNADKAYCLTVKQDRQPNSGLIEFEDFCRYLTRRELERCQTVPDGYTDMVSYNQCQKVLGNGWTVDVIAHIFNNLQKSE